MWKDYSGKGAGYTLWCYALKYYLLGGALFLKLFPGEIYPQVGAASVKIKVSFMFKITLPLLETTFPSTETVVIVNHLRSGQNDLVVNRVPSFSYITIEPDADGFTIEPVIDSVTGWKSKKINNFALD